MNADYVENIIRNIDKQSYKCILVDGAWGIGKSYMVNNALKDMRDRACFISLFGMGDCQKIYHEALFQFVFRTSGGGKIASNVQNFAKAAGNFCTEISKTSNALAQAVSESDLLAMTAEKFKKNRIIVIDDLERRKSGLELEELFGVIESLKQLNHVKVILIANSKEIQNEDKEVFDKYKEKIIDRTFGVTEHSISVKWFDFEIDGAFVGNFLAQHDVKNLRTLQKAQNFFNEVSLYCSEIKDDKFISEIRQICFAVVVEDTDKLYYKALPEFSEQDAADNQKRLARVLAEVGNEMKSRLRQYTRDLKSGEALVDCIYKYYKNEKVLTKEEMKVYYRQYLKVGTTPNNYKSEEEIRRYIEGWKTEINETNGSTELTFLVGEYDRWYQVLGEDDRELIETYEKKLEEFFVDEAKKITPNPLDYYSGDEFDNVTQKVREIYDEVLKRAKCRLVQDYIEYLCEKTNDEMAVKCSGQLREWHTDRLDTGKYIEENLERLFTEKSFPVSGVNDCKYDTCCNIIKMLYQKDSEHFMERYNSLKANFDRMSIYRTEMIFRELGISN